MKHNLHNHEIIGIALIFFGGTSIGVGLYYIIWSALRNNHIIGKEMIIFPALFGLGLLLFIMGIIELKEIAPGKRRKK